MTIKQHGGVFGRNPSFNDVSVETLSIAGTALSSTAAELNILDGVTADATELNYLDGASTSAVVASKAVLADASGNIAFPDGKGIDFSATAGTGTSELFDDYEEGEVAQPLEIGGSNQTDYYTNETSYTKIGNVVTYFVAFDLFNRDLVGTGDLKLNLPFASFSGSGGEPRIIEEMAYGSASTKGGAATQTSGAYFISAGSNYAELYTDITLGAAISAPDTSERYIFRFVITYRSA